MKMEFFNGSFLIRPETDFERAWLQARPQGPAEVVHNFRVDDDHKFIGLQIIPLMQHGDK